MNTQHNIKEGKHALTWTRLSCTMFISNKVRLALFLLAYNLGRACARAPALSLRRTWMESDSGFTCGTTVPRERQSTGAGGDITGFGEGLVPRNVQPCGKDRIIDRNRCWRSQMGKYRLKVVLKHVPLTFNIQIMVGLLR